MTESSTPAGDSDEPLKPDGAPEFDESALQVCLQCGFTVAEFRTRGLLGCPACYAHFDKTLRADMLHVHPGLHKIAAPTVPNRNLAEQGETDIAALREQLSDALRFERYEEAAGLKQRLQRRLDAELGDAP
jgi:protein arginine kinase activator